MNLKDMTNSELQDLVVKTTDKDALREIATFLDVGFSGNTGMETLKTKLTDRLNVLIAEEQAEEEDDLPEEELDANDPVAAALIAQIAEKDKEEDVHVPQVKVAYTIGEMLEMDASKVKDDNLRRQVIRAQAMRLRRVRINNVDPNDANVPSTLVTCYSKYTGKVSKVIPHDADFYENGYHIPQIILDELVKGMKWKILDSYECIHNYVDASEDTIDTFGSPMLRKGAISAKTGEQVIIPINMRDGIILGTGLGNTDWNYSAPHGAGRIQAMR